MCLEVYVEGEAVDHVKILRERLGTIVWTGDDIEVLAREKGIDLEEGCLCSVDIQATADKAGFKVAETDDPFVPYALAKKATASR